MKWIELSDQRLLNLDTVQSFCSDDTWGRINEKYCIYFLTACDVEYFIDFPNEVRRDIVYRKIKEFLSSDIPLLHFEDYGE